MNPIIAKYVLRLVGSWVAVSESTYICMLHYCIVPCVGCFNISYRFNINIYIGSIFVFYIRAICLRAHHKQGVGPWGRLVRLKILSAILSTNTTRCFLDIWWKSYLFSIVANLIWRAYLIFVIFFTQAKLLENKIYTEKTRKLRQNTQ